MSGSEYPNVHVRLRLAQRAPATPPGDAELEIWLKGARFRVRDLARRRVDEILADVTAPRGLGAPARTMEDLMDRESAARVRSKPGLPPTELFGDRATDQGWVYPARGDRWPMPAHELAPAAEQILGRDKERGLVAGAGATRLGRAGTEYRGLVTVTEDGAQYTTAVSRLIAPPYLLFEEAHDAANPELSYVREVLALEEGVVTDADVTPPER